MYIESADLLLAVILQVFLVFGRSGWIGGLVGELLTSQGTKFEFANARLEDRAGILADIERVRFDERGGKSSGPVCLECSMLEGC